MASNLKQSVRLSKFLSQAVQSLRDGKRTILQPRQIVILGNYHLSSTSSEGNIGKNFDTDVDSQQRDPLPLFCSERVQAILSRITGFDVYKINHPRKSTSAPPKYHLLTDEQLKQTQEEAETKARERLQMPPYMKVRKPITDVLAKDEEISGLYNSKYVFTDISYALPDRKRHVVVREPDGTLRKATWDERDRINQIYNPQIGRKLFVPKMFESEHLERLLSEGKYEYVLDCTCVQFEPDSSDFIRVSHRTYEVVNSKHDFDNLRSTRHFGPMAFYLTWHRQVDHLLLDMLKRDKLSDAADLLHLYHTVHPHCKSALSSTGVTDQLQLIEIFTQTEASEKGQIELALQAYYSEQKKKAV